MANLTARGKRMQSVKPVKSVHGSSIRQAQNYAVGSTLARHKEVPLFFFWNAVPSCRAVSLFYGDTVLYLSSDVEPQGTISNLEPGRPLV